MDHYNQLKDLLNDLFELNKADLDFGIYRIMNQKRKQVNEFIDKRLPEDIKKILSETQTTDKAELEKELKEMKKSLEALDIKPDENAKYKAKLEQLNRISNIDSLEQEVFSHLTNFFKRYYKDGDFISMRRYKKDVYAIPYEGEEVKLYWANHDQYYIKSSENFKNYSFVLPGDKKVTFQLKEVSTEQNNNKTQGDAERRFALYDECPVEENGNELYINFIYEAFPKATKQESLLSQAIETLTTKIPASFAGVFSLKPTEKNKSRTLLEKHLNDYVSKNTFDYFIHKDLAGFLNRELDFYIKNEVLFLDDINVREPEFFTAQLSKVKAMKVVAQKIIDFLAQIENFQKKLWLKKKFVVSTNYCITLDRIPETYYPEIFQNKEQLAEWKNLFDITIQSEAQLTFEPYLVLDTKFFEEPFKDRILAEFDNLDDQTDGLLFNSENFQALSLMLEKYQEKIITSYLDPPYNTSASEINYKNNYRDSSWLTLINERFSIGKLFLRDDAVQCTTIDDVENSKLQLLLETIFGIENIIGIVPIKINPSGRPTERGFALTHEYAIFSTKTNTAGINKVPRTIEQLNRFDHKDSLGLFEFRNFRREGSNSDRENGQRQFYPIYGNVELQTIRVPKMEWDESSREWIIIENALSEETVIYPVNDIGREKNWRWSEENVRKNYSQFIVRTPQGGISPQVYYKYRPNEEGITPLTMWTDSKYSATEHGTKLIKELFTNSIFAYPKSIHAVVESLNVTGFLKEKDGIVLDFFAGSGTTGHAAIKINRKDDGKRKYILVEMGSYFNTVTKPRIEKVVYSDNWKNGKPQDKKGISQLVKYQVLESYEDTLNNLQLKPIDSQTLQGFGDRATEEFLLQYMLEFESRDHLCNIEMFRKPFDYQINITENNELKPVKVDLVETFNYLIGLYVNKVQRVKDIKVVEGITRTGVKTLVIWRDLDTTTHDDVVTLIRRFYDSARTAEFDQIYINGDHHLENLRQEGDRFKIKQIEDTFFKKMFNESKW
jgi:adenine-specific DNA-methyltransferase